MSSAFSAAAGWTQPERRTLEYWRTYAASCGSPPLARAILALTDTDPDVLLAVDDVDESLICSWLGLSPAERMEYALGTASCILDARDVQR
jgi:hypothetical protein